MVLRRLGATSGRLDSSGGRLLAEPGHIGTGAPLSPEGHSNSAPIWRQEWSGQAGVKSGYVSAAAP